MGLKRGLPPVIFETSRVLILGTLPGDESLRHGRYYCDPRNQFWDILGRVYGLTLGASYEDRLAFLEAKALALWDVLKTAERDGSTDEKIKSAVPNDFAALFKRHPTLRMVVLTSTCAHGLFRRLVERRQSVPPHLLPVRRVPSTSPTPGRYVQPLEAKAAKWKAVLNLGSQTG
jgi:hypoxanthine-DNA glycosylase